MKSARQLLVPVAAALVVATLLFARQIASWSTPGNRYYYLWQSSDGLALLGAVLLLAVILFALGMGLSRTEWARRRRLHEIALFIGLLAAILAQFADLSKKSNPMRASLLWAAMVVLLWLAWRRWPSRLPTLARNACLIMSPLVPILFFQILSWHPWDNTERTTPTPPSAGRDSAQKPPLAVLVVFDEWSWLRTAPRGQIGDSLTHLKWLAGHALLERETRSAAYMTTTSLPRILYQRAGGVVEGNGVAWWEEADSSRRPTWEVPDLFDRVRKLGYRSTLFGYYLPYRALLGPDGADRVVSYSHTPKRKSWIGQVGLMLESELQYFTDPISQWVWPKLFTKLNSEFWRDNTFALRDGLIHEIQAAPDRTLIVAHLPVPHFPYIWNPNGTYRGPFKRKMGDGTPEDYYRNVRFTDTVLGQIVDALQRAGRFDRSLLIITSDHSWRAEQDSAILAQPDATRRVPLVIKWPGQTEPLLSDQPFCNAEIGSVIEAALATPQPTLTDSLWRGLARERPERPCAQDTPGIMSDEQLRDFLDRHKKRLRPKRRP